ncbi:MAG TPA: uridine diphosphate-N-acetylglucosamine-binding protein YvcK [Jatrophihabitans sp.]|nr:uridine diphosphate-N-acetylglucosamine-binding protein YvcK [Jatrophihabitans sp.]
MRPASTPGRPRVVALGGGHGLYASLSALRPLDIDITAVVTVADDGGSSGRIRRELGVLPPGDLRMALAALAGTGLDQAGASWPELLQHRLGGTGALAGHPIGNLLLTGLFDLLADPVRALDLLGELTGARGRVLPMAAGPLDLLAEVASVDPDDPVRQRRIRGQSAIAATAGRVTSIRLVPERPPACAEAVTAIERADAVILGPGSWFTSVIPHLLVPELARALAVTGGRRIVILNLEQQAGETEGFSPEQHLRALRDHCPALPMDVVIADADSVLDPRALRRFTGELGSRLLLAEIAAAGATARHDPGKLSSVIADAIGLPAAGTDGEERHPGATDRPGTEQGVR